MELFKKSAISLAPLAERMRPNTLDKFVGQLHLTEKDRMLRSILERGHLCSIILWGPPGVGKTTFAHLFSTQTGSEFVSISAVTSGVKDLQKIMHDAEERLRLYKKRTILFIDEIHRFNKAQQDYLLPFIEKGIVFFIGATTENPSFEIISPLLSRCRVFVLERLKSDEIKKIILNALSDSEKGLGKLKLILTEEALNWLSDSANGDARSALSALELAAKLSEQSGSKEISLETIESALSKKQLYHDKSAEGHYNILSAFIKSMRGSDPDAALYWMCRLLEAGEDPLLMARRMVIFAAEDIGNADPQALILAIATLQAVDFIGLPEARIPLAQGVTYLATAKKSNASYMALQKATEAVHKMGNLEVPMHLRNAVTPLMKEVGYGKGYQYAHHYKDAVVSHNHLPDALKGNKFYLP